MTSEIEPATEARNWLYQPIFPAGWTPAPLYSLARWVNGLAFRDIQFTKTGRPVIKIAEIKGGITGQTKFTTQTFDEKVRVQPGDMLFSWSGQPETSIDVFRWDGPEGWLNQHVFKLTAGEKLLPDFLFYLLRYLKPNLIAIAKNKQTTGLGHVTKRDLERMSVAYPTKDEQREIVAILGAIDGRIDALRRINATLEEMARALFQSWFVDFDPVRAKAAGREPAGIDAATAALFTSSIEESAMGQIPAGWKIKTIGECCERIFSGGTPNTSTPRYWNGDIPWLSSGETRSSFIVDTEKTITKSGVENSSSKQARAGCTVIASAGQGQTRGQASLLTFDSYINQSVVVLAACHRVSSDLFLFFDLSRRYDEFRQISDSHSSRGSLTTKLLAGIKSIQPPPEIISAFDNIVKPTVSEVTSNLHQIRMLSALRETLLPKLMSGELSPAQSATEVEHA